VAAAATGPRLRAPAPARGRGRCVVGTDPVINMRASTTFASAASCRDNTNARSGRGEYTRDNQFKKTANTHNR
jgi:hypothetical protein